MAFTFLKTQIICSLCRAFYPESPAAAVAQQCRHDPGDKMAASSHQREEERDEPPRAEENRSLGIDSLKERATALEEVMKRNKEKVEEVKTKVKALCRMLLTSLRESSIIMEADIAHQKIQVFKEISDEILTLKKRESLLSREIKRVEDLCRQLDLAAFMQDSEKLYREDQETGRHSGPPRHYPDIDFMLFSLKFYKTFQNFAQLVPGWLASHCLHLKHKADFLLDRATASRSLRVLPPGKAVLYVETRGEPAPGRFRACNVLGDSAFTSGKHYWEVSGSRTGVKSVGVAYPSMEKGGLEGYLGYNQKSWCLTWCCGYAEVCHDSQCREVGADGALLSSVAVYLDYEAGRISFYRIGNPILHLYTFFASFTEPLHPAFYLVTGSIKINP